MSIMTINEIDVQDHCTHVCTSSRNEQRYPVLLNGPDYTILEF